MLAVANEADSAAGPAPVRHPVAQAVPTQPLQVASVAKAPDPSTGAAEKESVQPYTAIGEKTGRLLTPAAANKPQFKFK
jgi:hypothetical protein